MEVRTLDDPRGEDRKVLRMDIMVDLRQVRLMACPEGFIYDTAYEAGQKIIEALFRAIR